MEAHKIARELGFVGYYEVSAQEGINVNKPVEDLVQAVYFVNNFSLEQMQQEDFVSN